MSNSTFDKNGPHIHYYKSMIFKQIPTAIKDMNKLGGAINSLGNINSDISIANIGLNSENLISYQNAIKGLSAEQAVFALATKKVSAEQIQEIMTTQSAALAKGTYAQADIQAALAKNKLAAASTLITAEQRQEIITSGLLTSEKMAEMISVLGLTETESGALISKKALNAEMVKQQLTSIGVTGAAQTQMLGILGITAAEGAAVVGTNLLTAAFQKLKQTIMSNPYLFIIGAILAGVIAVYNIIKKFHNTLEKQQEVTRNLQEELSKTQDEISKVNSELETVGKRIEELNSKENLSFVEKDELNRLIDQNKALEQRNKLLAEQENNEKKKVAASVKKEFDQEFNEYYSTEPLPSQKEEIAKKKERYYELRKKDGENSPQEVEEALQLGKEIEDWEYNYNYGVTWEEHLGQLIDIYKDFKTFKQNELTEEDRTRQEKIREELVGYGIKLNDYIDRYGMNDSTSQHWTSLYNSISETLYTPEWLTEQFNNKFNGLSKDIQNELKSKARTGDLKIGDLSQSIIDSFSEIGLSEEQIIEQINAIFGFKTASSPSFIQYFNSADFSDAAQKLLDLAKAGEITPEVLESTEEYRTLLEKTGDSAQEAASKILDLLSDQEKLAAASNGIDSIKSAYDEFNELGFVTASTLESLPDVFKNRENFDIFSRIAGDPTQGKEKIRQAFNDIITEYLISQDTLSGIIGASESGIQSYIANLKEMGITNAEELVSNLRTIYKSDYDNWCDILTKKAASYNDFTNLIEASANSGLAAYYGYSGLTPELERKMKEGTLTFVDALMISGTTSEAQEIMEAQTKYQQDLIEAEKKKVEFDFELKALYDPSSDDYDASSHSSPQSFDWLQTKITRTEEALDRLEQKTSDTYSSWTERNNALSQSIGRTKAAIELQKQAYSAYMKEADSLGLPEHYKTLVQKGAVNVNDIVDSGTADKISEYQELYEKAVSCSDTVKELEQSLNELIFNTGWNNIKTKLDAAVGVFDADIGLLQTKLDGLEIRGLFADSSYYLDMKDLTAKKLKTRTSEASQLKAVLDSVPKNSEAFDSMFAELMDINKEIAELENNCTEFNIKIRDLDWEIFDYLEKSVSRITDETEYLIGLLEKEDLFDENGSLTKYGDAALGLHSAAYETYKRQADEYYAEITKLQKQLVDGAGQDVLDHYNELTDAHREAINAADSEKQSMLELMEDGYNAQLDAIQELIDKKKEQLNSEKNLYDYQKSIAEKTSKVSSLEKQKLAYADDNSEEAMSRIQQLNVQLEEAKADLAEAEYDKYLQDTEDMLDKLSEDYESWINARLDDEDSLLSQIIAAVSDKGDIINGTLNEIASKNDTFISDSIRGIFDADQPFATVMNGIKDAVTGVGTAITELRNTVSGMSGAGGNLDKQGDSSGSSWGKIKSHGYKSGTRAAVSGAHWTQENDGEFILRKSDGAMLVPLGQGDMVFSNESSRRLYEFAQNPEAFMKKYNLSSPVATAVMPYSVLDYKLPASAKAAQKNASASVSIGDINITCNEVQNARELMEDVTDHLIRNDRFEKAMSTMINNRMTGKNPLEHLKYVKH